MISKSLERILAWIHQRYFARPCRDLLRNLPKWHQGRSQVPTEYCAPHHTDFFEFLDCCHSPRGSCHLCQVLWRSFRGNLTKDRLAGGKPWVKCHKQELRVYLYAFGASPDICLKIPSNLKCEARVGSTLDATRAPKLQDSTESDQTFIWIKYWLHNCINHHTECQTKPGVPYELPTRLIRIEAAGAVFRLTTSFPKNSRYIALSYRWGSDISYALKGDTEAQTRDGASVTVLPKPLRDACVITSRLGLEYLWIDRLCIFQDSEKDWAHEASKMAQVYRNSFCTISAAGASTENGGCFSSRRIQWISPLELSSSPFPRGNVFIGNGPMDSYEEHIKLDHLADRAWTFQEQNLPLRILHFTREQVYWECIKHDADEVYPYGSPFGRIWYFSRPFTMLTTGDRAEWDHMWAKIVEQYSGRKLTYEKDKLPALSGLAQQMRYSPEDKYLAGLWRQSLPHGLFWFTSTRNAKRPKEYRAPSWSWASLDSSVVLYMLKSKYEVTPLATIKDAQVELTGMDPFGQVRGGWIALSGHIRQARVQRDSGHTLKLTWHDGTYFPDTEVHYDMPESFDSLLKDVNHIQVYCLPLAHDNSGSIHCLLLFDGRIEHAGVLSKAVSTPSDQKNIYRRAGAVEFQWMRDNVRKTLAWFLEVPQQEIIIV